VPLWKRYGDHEHGEHPGMQQVTTVGLDLAKMVCSQRTNSA
jgi:hypothetical protein